MSLAKSTFTVTGIGLFGMASGIILDAIVVAIFGLGAETDSYFVATTIPFALLTILSLQASKVVQPLFIHYRNSDGEAAGWRFLQQIITLSTLIMLCVAVAGCLLAPELVSLQTSGQPEANKALAIRLSISFFLMPVLNCPNIFMAQVLNGLDEFVIPGLAKILENVCKIVCAVLFFKKLGVYVLPVGLAVGIVSQWFLLYANLSRKGFRYRPVFRIHDPRISRAMGQSSYPLVGHLSAMGTDVIQNTLASFLGVGSLSALRLATRIVDAFAGLLGNSIITAVMPLVTQSLAENDPVRMKRHLANAVRLLILISIPASVWLLVMRSPLVALLFERMKFSATDTHLVCAVLLVMIPYIFFSRLFGLAETAFYGGCDTRTPLVGQTALTVLYIGGMLTLFSSAGVFAFALARSAAYVVASGVMLYLLQRRFGWFGTKALTNDTMKVCVACGGMVGLLLVGQRIADHLRLSGLPLKVVALSIPTGFGIAGFVASCIWLNVVTFKGFRPSLFSSKCVVDFTDV